MKETIKTLINIFALHVISIFSVGVYFISVIFLYPIGYFDQVLSYLGMSSVIGILFIYKKPIITKTLFIITALGAFLTILLYILTTAQDWTVFMLFFKLLGASCLILLLLAIYFLRA